MKYLSNNTKKIFMLFISLYVYEYKNDIVFVIYIPYHIIIDANSEITVL
jgi:hypothetical protein